MATPATNGSGLRQPAAPAAPAPADLDIDTHLAAGTVPAGWTSGQWARVQKLSLKTAELTSQLATAQASGTELATARGQLAAMQSRYDSDMAMVASGLPQLQNAEVRGYVGERYAAYSAQNGDKAQPFTEWFTAQQATPSPLLAPFLQRPTVTTPAPTTTTTPAAGAPAATGAGQQPQPIAQPANPAAGTAQPAAAAAGGLSNEQIGAAAQSVSAFRAQAPAIKQQLEAKYGVKIGK